MDSSVNSEKVAYKATKLWLDAVKTFRNGVKLGRHRSLLRHYDNCFVAQEAITWFSSELRSKFDGTISRKQTLHLLQKFYKAGVFVEVTNHSSAKRFVGIKETDFKDNKRLYKLVGKDAVEIPSARDEKKTSNQSGKADYYVVINQLSTDQIHKIWEQAFVERFVKIVGYGVFASFLKPGTIKGGWISHNLTRISPNGVVLVMNPCDELPSWIMNAMNCITRNDSKGEFGLPNYPGFENDVFVLIRDYFNAFKEESPLLTFELHDAFVTIFIRAQFTLNGNVKARMPTLTKRSRSMRYNEFVEEQYPFSASDSTENLLLDMFTPSPGMHKCENHFKESLFPRRIFGTLQSSVLEADRQDYDFKPMPDIHISYHINRYTSQTALPVSTKPEEPVFLETAFTSDRSPITRIISTSEIESSLGALRKPSMQRLQPHAKSASSVSQQFAYENPVLQLSPADLINHPKYSKLLKATELNCISGKWSNASFEASLKTAPAESINSYKFDECDLGRVGQEGLCRPYRSKSAANLSDLNRDRCGFVQPQVRSMNSLGCGVRQSISSQYATSPSKSAQQTMLLFSGKEKGPRVMTSEGKAFAMEAFRLLTLLLPARNRRYLHLLLQFMSRVAETKNLILDVASTNRTIVLNDFCRAILGCSVSKEYDEFLALQIVTFLMDNNDEIFDVTKSNSLKASAETEITEQQIEKVPMKESNAKNPMGEEENKENSRSKFGCTRVSLDEFENQRLLGATAQSLRGLLSALDALEDKKERKRHLKKFRKEYPHIFAEKFGDSLDAALESSTELEKEKINPSRVLKSLF